MNLHGAGSDADLPVQLVEEQHSGQHHPDGGLQPLEGGLRLTEELHEGRSSGSYLRLDSGFGRAGGVGKLHHHRLARPAAHDDVEVAVRFELEADDVGGDFVGVALVGVPMTEMEKVGSTLPYPYQVSLTADIRQAALRQERPELAAMLVGQGAPLAVAKPAAQLFRELVTEADQVAARLSGGAVGVN